MHFTINGITCEKALVCLRYNGKQKLIPAPVAFEDAVREAVNIFRIPLAEGQGIELETEDIPGCGVVSIEPAAWEILLPCLKLAEVKVVEREADAGQAPAAANVPGPSKVAGAASQKPEAVTASAGFQRKAIPNPKPASSAGKKSSFPQTNKKSTLGSTKPKPATTTGQASTASARHPAQAERITSSLSHKTSATVTSVVQPLEDNELLEEVDEDDEEIVEIPPPRSPRKAKRQRVDSDVELDEVQAPEASTSKRTRHSVELEDEAKEPVREEPDRQVEIIKPVNGRTSPVLTPKEEPISNRNALPSSTSPKKTDSDITVVPKERDPSAGFVININFEGYGEESSSPFKTKNRHTVRKVLAVACHTLEIPEEDRARASLYIYESEAGEYTLCPEERTIGECGITETSLLYILLDEDEEE